jgi:hypothetical protein
MIFESSATNETSTRNGPITGLYWWIEGKYKLFMPQLYLRVAWED